MSFQGNVRHVKRGQQGPNHLRSNFKSSIGAPCLAVKYDVFEVNTVKPCEILCNVAAQKQQTTRPISPVASRDTFELPHCSLSTTRILWYWRKESAVRRLQMMWGFPRLRPSESSWRNVSRQWRRPRALRVQSAVSITILPTAGQQERHFLVDSWHDCSTATTISVNWPAQARQTSLRLLCL